MSLKRQAFYGVFLAAAFALSGCSDEPTFPKDKIKESMASIAEDLYQMKVVPAEVGSTIGVLYYADTIVTEDGTAISPAVTEKLGNLSQVVTRVGLSTDKDVDFIVVSVRGRREGLELKVIRYLDDIKRAYAEALSTTESMARTVFDQLPFDPSSESKAVFDLEEYNLPDFLTAQVLQRARYGLAAAEAENKDEEEAQAASGQMPQVLFDGTYRRADNGRSVFEFSILTLQKDQSITNIKLLLDVIRDVLGGYKYSKYDKILIRDLLNLKLLEIEQEDIMLYKQKKLTQEDLIKRLRSDKDRSKLFKQALEVFDYTKNN